MRSRPLEELKDRFLSNVSHEFRSPLASLIGYLDLIARDTTTLPEKHREYLKIMKESAARLKTFVDNLMDLTQLEDGLMECSAEPTDVKALFETTVESYRQEAAAQRVKLSVECAPHLCALADPVLARKILGHLLSNAFHFTPDGGEVSVWAKDSGHKSILMGISDSGIGIPRDMHERVFEKFEQVEETKNKVRKAHGTGLGLAIARQLVESQGGKIWVQQSSRKGTTIAWVLPKPGKNALPLRSTPHQRLGRAA